MKQIFFHFFIILGIIGCQGLQTNTALRPELSLSMVKEIQVGKTKQSEIVSRLGKPDRVFDISQTNLGGKGKIWAYLEGGFESIGRISLSFPADSDIVDSVSWDVRDGDPEKNLENALSQFKGINFVKTRPKAWENPHSSPDEIFYEDSKTGIVIVYLQTPKRVAAISWVSPGRTTSSEPETMVATPYPYCIVGLCASQPKR